MTESDYCNKCGACCKNIAVDFEKGVMFRDGIQPLSDSFANMLTPAGKKDNVTTCNCKYLKNNLCTNPNKPEECRNYPSSPFAFLPDGCGYEGNIFMKKESVKQKVRRFKEEIIHYTALIESGVAKDDARQYQKIINSHLGFIERYGVYGSADW